MISRIKTIGLLCVMVFPLLAGGQANIAGELDEVVSYLRKHYPIQANKESMHLVMCIGAPEIIRYQYFLDFLETPSLELLYINHGSQQADFSIGLFQMKPSFVETLEKI